MSRAVAEWIGATDNTPVPPRVRLRVFTKHEGRCTICTRKILAGEPWTCEHVKALINGGQNRESNLGVTCCNCLPDKNAADVAEKAVVYRKRAKHVGVKTKASRPIPSSKASPWKRKLNGEVVRR